MSFASVSTAARPHGRKFEADLLYKLNLLKKTLVRPMCFRSVVLVDYLKTVYVNWEILPPGEDTRTRIMVAFSRSTAEIQATINERYDLLSTLNPIAFINGTNGFDRYFGAKFSDKLVVFENVKYGNAAYVMNDRWQELSQRSRLDLLKERPDGFMRIRHTSGWEDRLRALVAKQR